MKTQVCIIGAGPSGLLLSQLLSLHGIKSIVLEKRSRCEIESTIRAGVLHNNTVQLLEDAGVAYRLKIEGSIQNKIIFRFGEADHAIDLCGLSGGHAFTIYGQNELIKDLIRARLEANNPVHFNVKNLGLCNLTTRPEVKFELNNLIQTISCDFVVGCDGANAQSRTFIPEGFCSTFARTHPSNWLGILAKTEPWQHEVIYSHHKAGFTLLSFRSPEIQRLYLQCGEGESINHWPDKKIWAQLRLRQGKHVGGAFKEGEILQKEIFKIRSVVRVPMQYGKLFLVGDAAHIVPPMGAKGLNLAVSDVKILWRALSDFYSTNKTHLLEHYSETALDYIWKTESFAWWMTNLFHKTYGSNKSMSHASACQLAKLERLVNSKNKMTAFSKHYMGVF
jgi:p-hydroxybenzoate 3-monooxygenase